MVVVERGSLFKYSFVIRIENRGRSRHVVVNSQLNLLTRKVLPKYRQMYVAKRLQNTDTLFERSVYECVYERV
jgi:hypothetical protein